MRTLVLESIVKSCFSRKHVNCWQLLILFFFKKDLSLSLSWCTQASGSHVLITRVSNKNVYLSRVFGHTDDQQEKEEDEKETGGCLSLAGGVGARAWPVTPAAGWSGSAAYRRASPWRPRPNGVTPNDQKKILTRPNSTNQIKHHILLTSSSFEAACVATSGVEEASFGAETACGGAGARLESAQLWLWSPDHRSGLDGWKKQRGSSEGTRSAEESTWLKLYMSPWIFSHRRPCVSAPSPPPRVSQTPRRRST